MDWQLLSVFERLIVIFGYILFTLAAYVIVVFGIALILVAVEDICEKRSERHRLRQKLENKTICYPLYTRDGKYVKGRR